MTIAGGNLTPKVVPFIAARFLSQKGTVPKTLPAKELPMLVKICVAPETAKPVPSVKIRA